jgi:signal transduction histidine kinase
MPRQFFHSTAEQVVQLADAVNVKGEVDQTFLETFCDLSSTQVSNALNLAIDLGLITEHEPSKYNSSSVLTRFFSTPHDSQKAIALRIALEEYKPFVVFRERLSTTNSADSAAQQTKVLLDLDAHREEVKDTLISLGTYAGAIKIEGGGRYSPSTDALANQLIDLAKACDDLVAAEARIRNQIGERAKELDRDEVLVPLANALLKAKALQPSDAVKDAAIAVESFLARLADRMSVSLNGASGIIQKLDKFRAGNHLPKKVIESAKYLGQLRNAADHGVDADTAVSSTWRIQDSSGLQYVYIACSFINACLEREAGGDFII